MGSPPPVTERLSRIQLVAEGLRAGLALLAIVLVTRACSGRLAPFSSTGWGVAITVISWGIASVSLWCSPRVPHLAWQDCLAPATVSLMLFPHQSGGTATGLGFVALGSACTVLANLLHRTPVATEKLVLAIEETSPQHVQLSATVNTSVSAADPPQIRSNEGIISLELPATIPPPGSTPAESMANEPALTQIGTEEPVDALDEQIPESWTRREQDSEVSIEAVVHARFVDGARQTTVHLPFIPPLASVPSIETESLESVEIEVAVESVQRHGVRLNVSRPSAGPTEVVPIGVVIYTSADEAIELR